MYADPSLIRQNIVKLSFNENESDLINAWVKYTGEQKAALLRRMVLAQAAHDLGMHDALDAAANEGPQRSLLHA